jgi:protein involved in polysaccharide export with SLBB domain
MVEGLTVPELHAVVSSRYREFIEETSYGDLIKEGDSLDLRFVYNPELNIGVRVRSDGKISLPLLGDVQAAGLRPGALRKNLIKRYAGHIRNPDVALLVGDTTAKKVFANPEFITVALTQHADLEIFVGGEVQAPKVIKFEGQITTLQAIMKAGGVKDTGDLAKVVVLRRGKFEKADWIQLNLSKPLSGASLNNDIALRNGDVVIVPMTGIAKVDLFVRQYIREVLPIQSFFNVTVIPLDAGAGGL